jgi:hypothetical protein
MGRGENFDVTPRGTTLKRSSINLSILHDLGEIALMVVIGGSGVFGLFFWLEGVMPADIAGIALLNTMITVLWVILRFRR